MLSNIISITSLVLCILFFMTCRAWLKKRTGHDRILSEYRKEVSKLVAEIDAATDRDFTLIEERIKSLKGILEEVDKRIILHGEELKRRQQHADTYAELGRKRFVPPVEKKPAQERITVPQSELPAKELSLAERVAELARAGFSPNLIAAKLGVSISEVELAIAITK